VRFLEPFGDRVQHSRVGVEVCTFIPGVLEVLRSLRSNANATAILRELETLGVGVMAGDQRLHDVLDANFVSDAPMHQAARAAVAGSAPAVEAAYAAATGELPRLGKRAAPEVDASVETTRFLIMLHQDSREDWKEREAYWKWTLQTREAELKQAMDVMKAEHKQAMDAMQALFFVKENECKQKEAQLREESKAVLEQKEASFKAALEQKEAACNTVLAEIKQCHALREADFQRQLAEKDEVFKQRKQGIARHLQERLAQQTQYDQGSRVEIRNVVWKVYRDWKYDEEDLRKIGQKVQQAFTERMGRPPQYLESERKNVYYQRDISLIEGCVKEYFEPFFSGSPADLF
jgi:hypothetical protein